MILILILLQIFLALFFCELFVRQCLKNDKLQIENIELKQRIIHLQKMVNTVLTNKKPYDK